MNALLCLVLAAAPADDLVQRQGGIEARPALSIPDEGAGPSLARVGLTIRVSGPPSLEVEPPRLEDALSAWHVPRRASSWHEADAAALVEVSLALEQAKPGVVNLPGVALRARAGGGWETFTWPDLLHEARPGGIVETEKEPPSPWPARLGVGALAIACALALASLGRVILRRPRHEVPAHLLALAKLEDDSLPNLDSVVREYLDERFGLSTRRQTAAEMLACGEIPSEAKSPLAELAALAELAKYAGVAPDARQRRRAADLARQVILTGASVPVAKDAEREENAGVGGAG